jgi:hypothetical protein
MNAERNPSKEDRVKKALDSLEAARLLQRDWMIWGVDCVHRHVEGVDGDWLEKWGEDEKDEEPVRDNKGSLEPQVLNLNNSTQKKRPKRAMLWAIVK